MEKALQIVFSQQVKEVTAAEQQPRKVPTLWPACVEAPASHDAHGCAISGAVPRPTASPQSLNESPVVFNSNKAAAPALQLVGCPRPLLSLASPTGAAIVSPQNSPSVLATGACRRQVRVGGGLTGSAAPQGSAATEVNANTAEASAPEGVGVGVGVGGSRVTHVDPAVVVAAKPGALLKSLAVSPEAALPNAIRFDAANSCTNSAPLLGVSDSSESLDSCADEDDADSDKKRLLLSDSGDSKEEKASSFFRARPRLGQFTPMIEWLLHCGESAEVSPPPPTMHDGVETPSTMLSEDFIGKLCAAATEVLAKEPTLLELEVAQDDTLIVVGDIHGQFQDLYTSVLNQQYNHRRCNPAGSDRRFLFMGDYVDRGPHSLEVVLLLLALKVEYPSLVYLTRGNHEEEKTSRVYGFLTEATSALGAAAGAAVWSAVNKVFLDLPLAAIVTTPRFRFIVMHGGLSPALQTVDQIASINRRQYNNGELSKEAHDIVDGLLWSDPAIGIGCFGASQRGCGWSFGPAASNAFCTKNKLSFICRAHQLAMDGYFWTHNDRVVTVFSAPNYCSINDNRGAVMVVSGCANKPSFEQYDCYEDEMEYGGAPSADFPYSSYFC